MFKKFKILFLILLSLQATAQQKFEIDLSPVYRSITNLESRVKALEKGGVIDKSTCVAGPTIGRITEISAQGVTVEWHGQDVFHLKYTISGMGKMYVDSVKPSGSKIEIKFPSIFPNGQYSIRFDGLSCSGTSNGQFTIAGGVDPPSALDCGGKPISFKINGFTNEAATVQFDAEGLTDLILSLVQDGKPVASKPYHPDVNTLYFPFGKVIPAGVYEIQLTPVSCNGKTISQPLVILKGDIGTVEPPVITDPGKREFKQMTEGLESHMQLTKRLDGDFIYVTDNTSNDLRSGYEYGYIAGAELILSPTPIKDYPFAANNGFRVVKMLYKKGIGSINRWPGQGEPTSPGGYYDADAGQSFPYNATASVETGFVSGSQSGFVSHTPAGFNPASQMPQWADVSPEAKLSPGRFFVLSRSDWPIEQIFRKGVTHVRHNEIPRPNGDETLAFQLRLQGKTYSDVPLSTTIFGGKPSEHPTKEEVQRMINLHQYPDVLHIGETMEQSHAIRPESTWLKDFNAGFVANQKKLFDSKGIKSLNCFNYFQFWPESYHLGQVSPDSSKRMFRLTPDKMPYSNFSPGAPLSTTNLITEAVYLGPPDIQQSQPLDLAFKLMLFDHMGYTGGVFLASEHEWRPNNFFKNVYPEGKYYNQGKIPLDPNTIITSAFFSQVFGKVFVQWGGAGKTNAGRIFDSRTPEPTYWQPNGSTELKGSYKNPNQNADRYSQWITTPDFPHSRIPGPGYYGYNAGTDLSRFGLQVYLDTWGQLEGGDIDFLSFCVDDNQWINAANAFADDIIDANVRKGGFVHSIRKDGRIAWYYINPFADNKWHELKVKFPNGKITTNRVAGNGIHAKIEAY